MFLCWGIAAVIAAVSYHVVEAASTVSPTAGGAPALFAGGLMTVLFILLTWGASEGIEWSMRRRARRQQQEDEKEGWVGDGTSAPIGVDRSDEMDDRNAAFTLERVAQHSSAKDCFIVVSGAVLDVSKWIGRHPGGAAVLVQRAGTDCTTDFFAANHSQHTRDMMLETFRVGWVVEVVEEGEGEERGGGAGGGSGTTTSGSDAYVALPDDVPEESNPDNEKETSDDI